MCLIGYGTGAIMAVPAHDTRDFEFAEKFGLPIDCIMDPAGADEALRSKVLNGKACWTEDGIYINSAKSGNRNLYQRTQQGKRNSDHYCLA